MTFHVYSLEAISVMHGDLLKGRRGGGGGGGGVGEILIPFNFLTI